MRTIISVIQVLIMVVEADQSGACLRAEAQPIRSDYGQKCVSRKHEMWLARAQEHSEEEDRGAGCEPTEQRAAPPPQLVSSSKKGCVFFIKNQEILGNLNIQIASIKKSIDAVNKITTF